MEIQSIITIQLLSILINTTTAIYKSQALPGKACGQHIEFLIMDPMPTGEEEIQEYIKYLRIYTELMSRILL